MYEDISAEEYHAGLREDAHLLLDVRTEEEYADYRIAGAVNIPLDELAERVEEIRTLADGKPIVAVCKAGVRSIMAAQILRYSGLTDLPIYNLDTGIIGWAQANLPLER